VIAGDGTVLRTNGAGAAMAGVTSPEIVIGRNFFDFVAADGAEGDNADYLWVYGREGEKCLRCKKSVIRRAVHQGRATYFCPTCQTP